MSVSRRSFLGMLGAGCGGLVLPRWAWAEETAAPNLRFGVVSDVHVGVETYSPEQLAARIETALRWFDAQGVDAVMVPGDIAHSGKIPELERFAAIWNCVFPNGKGSDGQSVARLFVTGNHDLDAWWLKGTAEWRAANVFVEGDNRAKVWERLFNEPYELIWKKVVKGYTFVGAQWPTKTEPPPLADWFRSHADELRGAKPFFFTQHAHPKGTCGNGLISMDDGSSTRVLSAFPNAVAITGHSHHTLTDDSSVWQGNFTSINAGCLSNGISDRWHSGYDSIYPHYSAKRKENRMKPLDGREAGCGLLVSVYDDHLVVERRAFACDLPLGPAWVIPLPAAQGGAFDPARQKAASAAPDFAPDAQLTLTSCAVAPEAIAGEALKGKPCFWLKIPPPVAAASGGRVFDFAIDIIKDEKVFARRFILANGYNLPEAKANRVTDCLFGIEELPPGVTLRVTPRNAFGKPAKAGLEASPVHPRCAA